MYMANDRAEATLTPITEKTEQFMDLWEFTSSKIEILVLCA